MERKRGPYPGPAFLRQIAANDQSPMLAVISGEITADQNGLPIGAANMAGKLSNVWLSVGDSGKDDSNTLSITADVYINGVSCLSTQPAIAHVSGESSTNKTTKESGDGITQAVIDTDNNDVSLGDMITCDVSLTRTASPTTEIANLAIVVEFEPS